MTCRQRTANGETRTARLAACFSHGSLRAGTCYARFEQGVLSCCSRFASSRDVLCSRLAVRFEQGRAKLAGTRCCLLFAVRDSLRAGTCYGAACSSRFAVRRSLALSWRVHGAALMTCRQRIANSEMRMAQLAPRGSPFAVRFEQEHAKLAGTRRCSYDV